MGGEGAGCVYVEGDGKGCVGGEEKWCEGGDSNGCVGGDAVGLCGRGCSVRGVLHGASLVLGRGVWEDA